MELVYESTYLLFPVSPVNKLLFSTTFSVCYNLHSELIWIEFVFGKPKQMNVKVKGQMCLEEPSSSEPERSTFLVEILYISLHYIYLSYFTN